MATPALAIRVPRASTPANCHTLILARFAAWRAARIAFAPPAPAMRS